MTRRAPLETVNVLTARITTLEADRETAIALAVTAGATWAEIGRALGVTAQAAHKRYRWLRHSPATGETWHEPPLAHLDGRPSVRQ
jgi:transposase-like protein